MVDTQDLPTLQETGVHLVSTLSCSPPASLSITDASSFSLLNNFQFHLFLFIPTVTGIVHVSMDSHLSFLSPWPILCDAIMMFQRCWSDFLKLFSSFSLSRIEHWSFCHGTWSMQGLMSFWAVFPCCSSVSSSARLLATPHPVRGAPCLLFPLAALLCLSPILLHSKLANSLSSLSLA